MHFVLLIEKSTTRALYKHYRAWLCALDDIQPEDSSLWIPGCFACSPVFLETAAKDTDCLATTGNQNPCLHTTPFPLPLPSSCQVFRQEIESISLSLNLPISPPVAQNRSLLLWQQLLDLVLVGVPGPCPWWSWVMGVRELRCWDLQCQGPWRVVRGRSRGRICGVVFPVGMSHGLGSSAESGVCSIWVRRLWKQWGWGLQWWGLEGQREQWVRGLWGPCPCWGWVRELQELCERWQASAGRSEDVLVNCFVLPAQGWGCWQLHIPRVRLSWPQGWQEEGFAPCLTGAVESGRVTDCLPGGARAMNARMLAWQFLSER